MGLGRDQKRPRVLCRIIHERTCTSHPIHVTHSFYVPSLIFRSAVAIDIYEQVYLLRRSLLQTGFNRDPETGQISRLHDPDLAELVAVFASSTLVNRDTNRLDEFTPLVSILDPAELEKLEQSRDREARRKRRQAKAKKVEPLSVRSPPKTMLTPLEYRGSVHRQLRLADDADGEPVPTSGRGRRRKHF